jgi:hypothetical protein
MKMTMTVGDVLQYKTLREKIAAEKRARADRYARFEAVFSEAAAIGNLAGVAHKPQEMFVVEHSNPADDNSPPRKMWHEPEGVCGFAWVRVRPATCSFAKWLKKTGKVSGRAYHGGVDIWISSHNQSYERKIAHASAMANVLREKLGVDCRADGRLD